MNFMRAQAFLIITNYVEATIQPIHCVYAPNNQNPQTLLSVLLAIL